MRKIAREIAFIMIYEGLFNKEREVERSLSMFENEKEILGEETLTEEDQTFIKQLVCLYEANNEHIDTLIKNNLFGYEPERLFKVDMALLCLALAEIYHYKTPPAIVVNEVVEISKKYSTEKSAKFINGILGAILKENPTE